MRIAVVGAGISGLVAAERLARQHVVEVFEAESWIGGHTHTVDVEVDGRPHAVDTGFIVYNERTYPEFSRLLRRLEVRTQPTEMSFSVRCDRSGLEYSGGSLDGLFAQRTNLVRPRFWGMLRDVARFWREAPELLEKPDPKLSLGAYLDARGYGAAFRDLHLIPMAAAIWSAEPARIAEFPAVTLVRFFANHGLLQLRDRPLWRVVAGGSRRYVEALTAPFRSALRPSTPVRAIRRDADGVDVVTDERAERFDGVVLALHADQALGLLADPTQDERLILGALRFQENSAVLHCDPAALPRSPRARAAWNYWCGDDGALGVTYWMNRLQHLDAQTPICVTLNRDAALSAERVLGQWTYQHPIFDSAAVEAQALRERISGVRRTHYCGAYWGYGFHEDGVRAGIAAARELGA